jgi:thymidylate kinase
MDQVNRLDRESLVFYEQVRAAYLALAAENGSMWKIIDASRPVDRVWRDVVVAVNDSQRLPVRLEGAR